MKKLVNAQSNKGFTLVELLVALLISGILLGTVSSVFLMSQKLYNRAGDISYKQGTITNTETVLQNGLSTATGVSLASTPKMDSEESYSIGFKNDGTCEEVVMSLVVDNSGNPVLVGGQKQYSKSVNTMSYISEIYVQTTGSNITTLSYKLAPIDTSMSTLSGGTVMNNVNTTNNNQPTQANLLNGTKLNDSGNEMHYLVLTYKEITGSITAPQSNFNDTLTSEGVILGNWEKMIAYAKLNYGYLFVPIGAVYTDSTGTYVTAKSQYIQKSFADSNPTAKGYYDSLGGSGNDLFMKISETTRQITNADYETDSTRIQQSKYWKQDQVPTLGDLYLYNGDYYIWQCKTSYYSCPKDATKDGNWLKFVSAPVTFQ